MAALLFPLLAISFAKAYYMKNVGFSRFFSDFVVFRKLLSILTDGMLLASHAKFEVFLMELTINTLNLTIPEQVVLALRDVNVPVYLSGYRCLCVAIPIFAQDVAQSMCNELYPVVAKKLGYVDWRAVEFAIRRAIFSAWKHRDPATWEEYFPGTTKVPTNKQFIATLAQRIK